LADIRVIFEKNSERIIKNERKRQKSVTSGFFDKWDNREKQGGRADLNSEPCAGEQTTSPFQQRLFRAGASLSAGRYKEGRSGPCTEAETSLFRALILFRHHLPEP